MLSTRSRAESTDIIKRTEYLIACILGVVHAIIVKHVNELVPEPYMDEIFHMRQTRKYCNGDYTWDPMITTPPLLYVVAMPLCGGYERFMNSFIVPFAFIGACRFRRIFASNKEPVILPALSILCLPVLLHSSFLFYTDLLSTTLVLWAYTCRSSRKAAILFGISLFARQTNIIWTGLYAGVVLTRHIKSSAPIHSSVRGCFKLWPFVCLAIGFLTFIRLNGGIVLGDPKAHQPHFHGAQVVYFLMFACFFASFSILNQAKQILDSMAQLKHLVLVPIIGLTLDRLTFAHPYLLADNRHVPFYVWRWLLAKPLHRQVLTPICYAALLASFQLSRRVSPVSRLLFSIATMSTILPAHLLEPRYFITPYVLWRLSADTKSTTLCVLELIFEVGTFASLFYLFLYKPFEWPHEPGRSQRFMW